jgi:molecular chaperone DnaK (HSP70)
MRKDRISLKSSKLKSDDIDEVLLVGGSFQNSIGSI